MMAVGLESWGKSQGDDVNRPRQVQGWRLQSLDWGHSGLSGYYVLHTMHPYGQGRSKPNILHASNVDIPRAMQPRLGMRYEVVRQGQGRGRGRDRGSCPRLRQPPTQYSVPLMLITGQQP